ncbi:MAG: hypothetical protein Q7S40_32060 [Opitutaceae bacterium]|nr:hypothetical protein [Opitutaceae bacterium]
MQSGKTIPKLTRRAPRILLALGVAACALLLGGCVYLRLLELKRQFAHFDRHFVLQTHDGVRIIAQNPVLLMDDVRWIGLRPETTQRLGQAEQWHIRWVKQLPPGVTEKSSFYIALDLTFANGKLSGIAIPESYFALLPKDFLIGVIKSLGGANVDKLSRKVEAAIAADDVRLARPNLPTVDKILGVPTEEREDGPHTIQRYRYIPATKESRAGVFEMTLRYHTKSGELLHWQGRTPMGNIAFDFSGKPAR